MFLSIVAAALEGILKTVNLGFKLPVDTTFWAEGVALVSFGICWFTASKFWILGNEHERLRFI